MIFADPVCLEGVLDIIGPLRGFLKLVDLLGVPYNKDYSIWRSILGSPYFGKLPFLSRVGVLGLGLTVL